MGGPQRAGKAPAPSAGRGAEPQGGWPRSGPPRPSAEPSSAPLPRGRPRKPRVPPRVRQVPGSPVGPVWRLGLSGVSRCSGGRAAALGSGAAWAVGPGPGREGDSPCAGSGTAGPPGLAGWACGLVYTGNSEKSSKYPTTRLHLALFQVFYFIINQVSAYVLIQWPQIGRPCVQRNSLSTLLFLSTNSAFSFPFISH